MGTSATTKREQSASLWTKTKTHTSRISQRAVCQDGAERVGRRSSTLGKARALSPAGAGARVPRGPGRPWRQRGACPPNAPQTKTTFDPAASGAVTASVGTHQRASGGCRGRRGPRRGPTCPKTGPFCTLESRTARPACAVLILPPLFVLSVWRQRVLPSSLSFGALLCVASAQNLREGAARIGRHFWIRRLMLGPAAAIRAARDLFCPRHLV